MPHAIGPPTPATRRPPWRARSTPPRRGPGATAGPKTMKPRLGAGRALAAPRVYGGIKIDDALMGRGRRNATAADIRAALALYRRADAILIGLAGSAGLL